MCCAYYTADILDESSFKTVKNKKGKGWLSYVQCQISAGRDQ